MDLAGVTSGVLAPAEVRHVAEVEGDSEIVIAIGLVNKVDRIVGNGLGTYSGNKASEANFLTVSG